MPRCVQDLPGELRASFLPMLGAEAAIWTPVQMLNFWYLPVRHQQMFVNVMSVVEAAVISWCAPAPQTTCHVTVVCCRGCCDLVVRACS